MRERRKFFRFESPIGLRYAAEGGDIEGGSRTENISREGAAFPIEKRLSKNDTLKMEFEIPGDNVPVFANGVVAWARKGKAGRKGLFDVGVRLVDISRPDRARILDYAYNRWVKKFLR